MRRGGARHVPGGFAYGGAGIDGLSCCLSDRTRLLGEHGHRRLHLSRACQSFRASTTLPSDTQLSARKSYGNVTAPCGSVETV